MPGLTSLRILVPFDLAEKAQAKAAAEDRALEAVVNEALSAYVDPPAKTTKRRPKVG